MVSKFAPKREDRLVGREMIPEEIKLVPGSGDYYVSKTGKVYREYGCNKYFPIKTRINERNGYLYAPSINGTQRVHRMVALAWIPNPNSYPVVGHRDNNKGNPCAENLYWTTHKGNTHDAIRDGLMWQDAGYDDSQSNPVVCYDEEGKLIGKYGSEREAHKATGASVSTITRQCKHLIKGRHRSGLYFEYQKC